MVAALAKLEDSVKADSTRGLENIKEDSTG